MPRSYTKVFDIVFDFYESLEIVTLVDASLWTSPEQAVSSIRRVIKKKRFDGIEVFSRKGDVFLLKR